MDEVVLFCLLWLRCLGVLRLTQTLQHQNDFQPLCGAARRFEAEGLAYFGAHLNTQLKGAI